MDGARPLPVLNPNRVMATAGSVDPIKARDIRPVLT